MDLEKVKNHTKHLRFRVDKLLTSIDSAIQEEDKEILTLDIEDINKYFRAVEQQTERLGRSIQVNK